MTPKEKAVILAAKNWYKHWKRGEITQNSTFDHHSADIRLEKAVKNLIMRKRK